MKLEIAFDFHIHISLLHLTGMLYLSCDRVRLCQHTELRTNSRKRSQNRLILSTRKLTHSLKMGKVCQANEDFLSPARPINMMHARLKEF